MNFEWDEDKRLSTLAKHEIDFLDARQLFDGRPVTQTKRLYAAEERYITVGLLNRRFAAAIWTLRNDTVRIISVRRTRKKGIASYHNEHSNGSSDAL